jgi:acetyltransferase-like isoleucine patch superfamily enzyme
VFIGSNVKILKGSVIGSGSVIANGAIVTGKIPSNVIAGGNPAKIIKAIEQ